jgi:hypothetical protein
MDVVIYVLPIFPLWNMQAPKRQRLEIIAIFTLGGGAVIVSLLRFIVLWQLGNTDDSTYVFGSVTIVTSIEFAVAIVTANMPGVAAFYKSWRATRKGRMVTDASGERGYEFDDALAVGFWPEMYNVEISNPSAENSRGRADGEEDWAPRVEMGPNYQDSSRNTLVPANDVRVDTEVVISHETVSGTYLGRGEEQQ